MLPKEVRSLDLTCPACRYSVQAIPLTPAVADPYVLNDSSVHLLVKCPRDSCKRLAYVAYNTRDAKIYRVFPFAQIEANYYHNSIPLKIREDVAEAETCRCCDAKKAVVVLCRRAMQQIAIDRGAKGKVLRDQIDDMFSQGLITKNLRDAAHELRHFGNFGAHPSEDALDDVHDHDIRIILQIVHDFMTDLYVRPFNTKKLTEKRNS